MRATSEYLNLPLQEFEEAVSEWNRAEAARREVLRICEERIARRLLDEADDDDERGNC